MAFVPGLPSLLFGAALFEMTGNRQMAQLGPVLVRIRNVRVFDGEAARTPMDLEDFLKESGN